MMELHLTVVIKREGVRYVASCPELDISRPGETAEHARDNVTEAVGHFLETADRTEIQRRLNRLAS